MLLSELSNTSTGIRTSYSLPIRRLSMLLCAIWKLLVKHLATF